LLVFGAASNPVRAAEREVFGFEGPLGEHGVPAAWSFRRWSPVTGFGDYEATARVDHGNGMAVLCMKSVRSGFIVGTKRNVDVTVLRQASWSWIAEALPAGGSFRERATNDQALQVLFAFDGGKVVSYVWDTAGPVGATGSGLSWQDDVRVTVLEAGPAKLGQWITERRDLYEDYRKLFGADPPRLIGVAIQSNSQHTDSTGAGCVGPVTLSGK
jgi:Protein of unknown function (DUF3047)